MAPPHPGPHDDSIKVVLGYSLFLYLFIIIVSKERHFCKF